MLRRYRFVYPVLILLGIASLLVIRVHTPQAQSEQTSLVTAIEVVAKHAIPAVVHIEVTERQEIANPLLPFENEPFFKYFFGNPKMPKKYQREVQGLGSGVIIDDSGHILTNYHVVGGAAKIDVMLADGRQFTGKSIKTVGTDPKTDLAVIQIVDKGPFPYLAMGDSDKMAVGQWVVAIGQPRGLSETVTQGIISAMHRRGISDPSSYEDYLQTDAAINPGNSGGPLVNLRGEVIGINAAIMSESGGFEGLGFAIPSNIAAHISQELIKNGKVIRGWLGVSLQTITPELAKSFGLSSTKGALVANVIKGSPADHAGIKQGDAIIAYQDKPFDDPSSLRNSVSLAAVGSEIKLTIMRKGAKQDITVKVGNIEEQEKAVSASLKKEFGIAVIPMTPKEANAYGQGTQSGVVVTQADANGVFGKAGFEKGDLILEVENQPVDDAASLFAILSSLKPKQSVNITAVDHKTGQSGNVPITLP
ncbi:putative periplasmic serine endoprotease DegP-like [Syntrophobacter sp. SbD1]|nr:putative periplasmic serine endoprotease DegP-like [Syntrophobacter sp. SbD1]